MDYCDGCEHKCDDYCDLFDDVLSYEYCIFWRDGDE